MPVGIKRVFPTNDLIPRRVNSYATGLRLSPHSFTTWNSAGAIQDFVEEKKVRPITREGAYFSHVFLANLYFSKRLALIHYTWLSISVLLPLQPLCV